MHPPAETKPEVLDKDPESYQWQARKLQECLSALKERRFLVEEGTNKYLEANLFPEDINENYLNTLQRRGLSIKKVLSTLNGSQIYFKIENFDLIVQYLEAALNEFNRFSNGVINKDLFREKTISLWRSFELSTKETKDNVSLYLKPARKLIIDVSLIEEVNNFESLVASAAQQSDLAVEVYGRSLEIDSTPSELRKIANFIDRIASIDEIGYISLGEFVSYAESSSGSSLQLNIQTQIKELNPDAPVIAVIDSGVQRGYLTEAFLLPGLDYVTDPDNPTLGNAREDLLGHGTEVACEIVYGQKNIVDYFVRQETDALIPLFKIFPVRVLKDEIMGHIDYDHIFREGGEFGQAVINYDIKIVNLSITLAQPKGFYDEFLSKTAVILDRFAKIYKVIFVVCTGNIEAATLKQLSNKFPNLEFFNRFDDWRHEGELEKQINIAPPADLVSGITVGSCFQQNSRFVVSSFSRSYSLKVKASTTKPEILSAAGDYPINLSASPPEFLTNLGRLPCIYTDFRHLSLSRGTSLAAPKVARTLGIGLLKYPDFSVEALKGVLLHKVNSDKFQILKRKRGSHPPGSTDVNELILQDPTLQPDSTFFHEAFVGQGGIIGEETKFFLDSDDEITIAITGEIKSTQILTYEIPIAKMLGNGTENKSNKIRLRLSTCIFPSTRETGSINLRGANLFHVGAIAHINSVPPISTRTSPNGREYQNQCIKSDADGVLIPWTSDYVSKEFPTFKTRHTYFIKEELLTMLRNDQTISLSIRGLHADEDDSERKLFTLVFSIEDLGATGQIRNHININI